MFRTFAATLLIAGSFSTTTMAGAFGIDMGTAAQDLKVVKPLLRRESSSHYGVVPPVPNPEFTFYVAAVNDHTGTCAVMAYSDVNEGDVDGEQVLTAWYKVGGILKQKYGMGTGIGSGLETDRTKSSDFAGSLYDGEGSVMARWLFEPGSTGDIKSIMLFVVADSPTSTQLALSYDFKNSDGCKS